MNPCGKSTSFKPGTLPLHRSTACNNRSSRKIHHTTATKKPRSLHHTTMGTLRRKNASTDAAEAPTSRSSGAGDRDRSAAVTPLAGQWPPPPPPALASTQPAPPPPPPPPSARRAAVCRAVPAPVGVSRAAPPPAQRLPGHRDCLSADRCAAAGSGEELRHCGPSVSRPVGVAAAELAGQTSATRGALWWSDRRPCASLCQLCRRSVSPAAQLTPVHGQSPSVTCRLQLTAEATAP